MPTRDFYNVLGVPRNASQEDIKQAYRSLARRWHPDRNGGDAAAAAKFKDIAEAYQCLSDPTSRARYDTLGAFYTADGRPPRPDEVNEVVSNMVNTFFGRNKNIRGEDLRYTIAITLEEVASGVEREVTIPRQVTCNTCGGDGADPDKGRETCQVCNGTGKSTGRLFRTSCYHCGGKGFHVVKTCPNCNGDGRVGLEDTLKVKVPSGVATGQKLKLAAKGNSGRGTGATGDLFVIVNVVEHPLFRRRGEDIVIDIPLTYSELSLGAEVPVPTLEGSTKVQIPTGSHPGKILRLAGRGLPRIGRKTRGDLHLQLQLEVPEGLPQTAKDALKAWESTLPHQCHPNRAAYLAAVQERS